MIQRLLDDPRVISIFVTLQLVFSWIVDRLTKSEIVFPLMLTLLSPALLSMGYYLARRVTRRVVRIGKRIIRRVI